MYVNGAVPASVLLRACLGRFDAQPCRRYAPVTVSLLNTRVGAAGELG